MGEDSGRLADAGAAAGVMVEAGFWQVAAGPGAVASASRRTGATWIGTRKEPTSQAVVIDGSGLARADRPRRRGPGRGVRPADGGQPVIGRPPRYRRHGRPAGTYAREVLRIGTDSTGAERSPMRDAQSRTGILAFDRAVHRRSRDAARAPVAQAGGAPEDARIRIAVIPAFNADEPLLPPA